jgi:malate/lactate dehydrogenase
LTGEYNLKEIYLGVPILLVKNGIEYIFELDLKISSTHIKEMMNIIDIYFKKQ